MTAYRNVLPSVEPGYLMKMLPENAPEEPEDWKTLLKDFREAIMPGVSNFLLTVLQPLRVI